jgi:hypothetical protein
MLALGCASDLLVQAPREIALRDPSALGKLASVSVTLGEVADAPSLETAVGQRGAAPLQPGGPIHLTEDVGTVLQRTVARTLESAGHRVVSDSGQAHVALRALEFHVDAPRVGARWEVTARVRLVLRVSARAGDPGWDEISALAEHSLPSPWRPGIATVERALRGCLDDLAALLAARPELAAALRKHAAGADAG